MAEELATMKPQVYKDERPAEYFTRFHEHSRTHEPDAVYEIVRCLTSAISLGFYRARAIATENVPGSGPVILAPNHFSFFDHFFLGTFIRRKIRFMAKSQLFQPPMQWVYRHGGVFPVRRGHRDEEAFITARTVLGRGACVAMYPEAGRSRTGRLGEKARPVRQGDHPVRRADRLRPRGRTVARAPAGGRRRDLRPHQGALRRPGGRGAPGCPAARARPAPRRPRGGRDQARRAGLTRQSYL